MNEKKININLSDSTKLMLLVWRFRTEIDFSKKIKIRCLKFTMRFAMHFQSKCCTFLWIRSLQIRIIHHNQHMIHFHFDWLEFWEFTKKPHTLSFWFRKNSRCHKNTEAIASRQVCMCQCVNAFANLTKKSVEHKATNVNLICDIDYKFLIRLCCLFLVQCSNNEW